MLDSYSSMVVVMQLTSLCKVWRSHKTCLPMVQRVAGMGTKVATRNNSRMKAGKMDLLRRLYRRNRRTHSK